MNSTNSPERFKKYRLKVAALDMSFDFSRMKFTDGDIAALEPQFESVFSAMEQLEGGAISNPDEGRMVGHYWLRSPALAPSKDLQQVIADTVNTINVFADEVHRGVVQGAAGSFVNILVVGIGGSALGPQFVGKALSAGSQDRAQLYFVDNTDPDGIEGILDRLSGSLGQTLTLVISKSGGTKETRNGMLEVARGYQAAGLDFARHAVAITGEGSLLDQAAIDGEWLRRFPMWDWVGGRTSELSAVGLLPAALQGIDINGFLKGAQEMDIATRVNKLRENPAALMAALWFIAGKGTGEKNMVIVPYKDRLELFSKYLQQLVMESLGKDKDLSGQLVNQGISVFGNKGSTDQHAYIQQLRDGRNDFFVTFLQVLQDRTGADLLVEEEVTSGDYLFGFLVGTQEALTGSDRESMSITVRQVDAPTVGALIAVFERAVGFYAALVGINAYHQPGVEAGKKAAGEVITLQRRLLEALRSQPGKAITVDELTHSLGLDNAHEIVFRIGQHLAANRPESIAWTEADNPYLSTIQTL